MCGIGLTRKSSVCNLISYKCQRMHAHVAQPVAESQKKWKSVVYQHFKVSLQQETRRDGSPYCISFVFTCKDDPVGHEHVKRKRMQTGHGTTNLHRSTNDCLRRREVVDAEPTSIGAQQTLQHSVSKYTPARHRALIAMRYAVSRRPFNIGRTYFFCS
jgi:hypothetical protein